MHNYNVTTLELVKFVMCTLISRVQMTLTRVHMTNLTRSSTFASIQRHNYNGAEHFSEIQPSAVISTTVENMPVVVLLFFPSPPSPSWLDFFLGTLDD